MNGITKAGSIIWPYAVISVPSSETKPIITNQCAIADPVKRNILVCNTISFAIVLARAPLFKNRAGSLCPADILRYISRPLSKKILMPKAVKR